MELKIQFKVHKKSYQTIETIQSKQSQQYGRTKVTVITLPNAWKCVGYPPLRMYEAKEQACSLCKDVIQVTVGDASHKIFKAYEESQIVKLHQCPAWTSQQEMPTLSPPDYLPRPHKQSA